MTFPALFPYRICDISTIFPPVIGCIKCPTDFPVLDMWHVSHFSRLTGCITFPTEFLVLDKWHVQFVRIAQKGHGR